MTPSLLDKLGDWNPQLFREIKGRLKPRNLLIAVAISLFGQLLLLLFFYSQLPFNFNDSEYCIRETYGSCLKDSVGNLIIDWPEWWQHLFITFSCINISVLLVAGTYMLISDLSQEERRATLNFIRLTPRSEVNILTGKLLGVPILLYLAAAFTVPLQLLAGLSAGIPLAKILSFWAIAVASCLFFYSAALLCSLMSGGRGGFLPWLGSGAVILFLMFMLSLATSWMPVNNSLTWLRLFSPFDSIFYLFSGPEGYGEEWFDLQWYYLPIGSRDISLVGFTLLNYGLWIYWIRQSLQRCFRNPNATVFSKGQSYSLVACLEVVILGFAVQAEISGYWYELFSNLAILSILNVVILFGLMALLSPQRQALQDWARYNQLQTRQRNSVQDLVWGEKSPAVVAMAINLAIATIPTLLWILLQSVENLDKTKILLGAAFFASWIMIYASLVQLILMMRTPKRVIWAAGTVAATTCLPVTLLGVLGIFPDENPTLWLFSTFPWVGLEYGTTTTVLMALLGKGIVLVLLNLQLRRQLKQVGESASKALLSMDNG